MMAKSDEESKKAEQFEQGGCSPGDRCVVPLHGSGARVHVYLIMD